jgi:hypothetical protein
MVDRGTAGFQLDLFAAPERIVVAPSGAVVHPVRRRMAGQLPRRRRPRKACTGYQVHQLELPFENVDDGEQDLSPDSQRLRLGRLNKTRRDQRRFFFEGLEAEGLFRCQSRN